jgi:hypothetical protein
MNEHADRNPHFGSSLEDLLEAEGLLEETTEHAIKTVHRWQMSERCKYRIIGSVAVISAFIIGFFITSIILWWVQ